MRGRLRRRSQDGAIDMSWSMIVPENAKANIAEKRHAEDCGGQVWRREKGMIAVKKRVGVGMQKKSGKLGSSGGELQVPVQCRHYQNIPATIKDVRFQGFSC